MYVVFSEKMLLVVRPMGLIGNSQTFNIKGPHLKVGYARLLICTHNIALLINAGVSAGI